MDIKSNAGCVLISWANLDYPEKMVILVGIKNPKNEIDIINYFSGKDAKDVYDKLFSGGNKE